MSFSACLPVRCTSSTTTTTGKKTGGIPGKKRAPWLPDGSLRGIALGSGVLLAASGLLGAGYLDMSVLSMALLYLALNIAYTIKLKQVPFWIFFTIAFGFVD